MSDYFKVKLEIIRNDQEYSYICYWRAYAKYKTAWWKPWVKVEEPIHRAEGREHHKYKSTDLSTFGGNFKEEYLEALHDEAYIRCIIHYRNNLALDLGNSLTRIYDLSIVKDFVNNTKKNKLL